MKILREEAVKKVEKRATHTQQQQKKQWPRN